MDPLLIVLTVAFAILVVVAIIQERNAPDPRIDTGELVATTESCPACHAPLFVSWIHNPHSLYRCTGCERHWTDRDLAAFEE